MKDDKIKEVFEEYGRVPLGKEYALIHAIAEAVAPQRTWVGLTEAQCGVLWKTNMTPFEYYQAIEAKLRSKNGY